MSTYLFHGAPGSFKTASATWFEVLPALRKGRLVVTNIEGILPLETIENELGETFPESAQLWRLSSQNDIGEMLWRNWFHWMPVGALVVMDEVQDIYPIESRFKPESCDYKHISTYKGVLPEYMYDYHMAKLEEIKPEDLTDADTDDLGIERFNEYGHVIYPKTLKEAYMRHRKYNWDILCCTPDIGSVHKYIRAVTEYAYAHKYFDGLSKIPYYYRRPRIHEHNPKFDGKKPNKNETINWKKVPLDVHKCYKSTATGSITEGKGKNFILSPQLFIVTLLFFCSIGFLLWYFFADKDVVENNSQAAQVPVESVYKTAVVNNSDDNNSVSTRTNVLLELPYNAKQVFVSGIVTKKDGAAFSRHIIFELLTPDFGSISLTNVELLGMGITTKYINECNVLLQSQKYEYRALCNPRPISNQQQDQDKSTIELQPFGIGSESSEV
ncbi:zonular occludens toxin domain-containing protein [Pseudoalteromonas sp. SSM20]|uniref:zonular occludens toxin domain-containing protein n=1 Tax=Pseudoalteromonas sp. SSM20 TaxID=3139394 RepID=UPI003BA9693E